jgi:Zn-dependent peptidase ImmA (M78 family)
VHYSPWADAADRYPDIHIERCDIAPARGAWVPSERVIFIDSSLDRPGRRATLAHELSHVDLGHRPTAGWFGRRMERDADDLAAQRLLDDVARVADAIAVHPLQPGMVAAELEVPLRLLRRRLERLTPTEAAVIEERLAQTDPSC